MTFHSLKLIPELIRAVTEQGYLVPTPIQQKAIPPILQSLDVSGRAQTGTGKTAGFLLPLLQRLHASEKKPGKPVIRALVLAPTRELAAQVEQSVLTYGKYLPFKSTTVFGGVNMHAQVRKLERGVDILVATPGRLLDHVRQRTLDLSHVEIFVLDEADHMLDMGFMPDVKKIISLLPKKRQNLLFSATFSEEIKKLAIGLLHSPVIIETSEDNSPAEKVEHVVHRVDRTRKRELLSFLIGSKRWNRVLVFARTKHGANRLAEQLKLDGIKAAAIHGDKSQGARTKALRDFKQGLTQVLVATDVAARGIDIDRLPHVVNFDLPNTPGDYIHRIGRTGRAGKAGVAVSLVCVDENQLLKSIERLLKHTIPHEVIPGYEPNPAIKAEPIPGRNASRNSQAPRNKSRSKMSDRRVSDRRASDRGRPHSETSDRRASDRRTSDRGRPHSETSDRRASDRRTSDRGRPHSETSDRRVSDRRASNRGRPDQGGRKRR